MVDGYTVEEAASVLGVPRERVWELLARGVLTGSTDLGGGMRVRLKADRPPDPPAAPAERPSDAPQASTDLTPFRELLTEFRSLTERYGQALLALGEARGEVAGLRSRVDMLEARVDLRLPSGAAPVSSSWDASPWPTPNERVVDAAAPGDSTAAPSEASTPAEPDHAEASGTDHGEERASHRRRARSGRRATESFADALARAEDPSPTELPGAAETAAALAGLRHDQPQDARLPAEDAAEADASLPRELPSADEVPVADEEASVETQFAGADRAQATEEDLPKQVDEDGVGDQPPLPGSDSEPAAEQAEPVESIDVPPADPHAELAAEPVSAASLDEPPADPDFVGPEPVWDADHYSAAIEEPDWISADDVAVAPTAWDPPRAEPAPAANAAVRAADEWPTETGGVPDPWTGRSPTATPESAESGSIELSGSRELDEALAALDALAHPAPTATETAAVGDADVAGGRQADPGGGRAPEAGPPPSARWVRTTPPPPLAVRSPASRAYRRLKRIFPT